MAVKKQRGEKARTFTKEQFLQARQFAGKRDLIRVLVSEEERCTVKEVETRIDRFEKGKVD